MTDMSLYAFARFLSQVLNPLTVMAVVTGWVVFRCADFPLPALALWAVCAFFGVFLPLAYVMRMRRLGAISELFIADRALRLRPLAWTALCYGSGLGVLQMLHAPVDVRAVMLCCAVLAVMMCGITFYTKISLHAVGAWSGFVMGVFWGGPVLLLPVPFAVSWARVILGAHTHRQVVLGGALGAGVTGLILYWLVDRAGSGLL